MYNTQAMVIYILSKGTIETNTDGEVVGVTPPYFDFLGEDISYVVKKAKGIRRADEAHAETRLSAMQGEQRFKRYRPSLLRKREQASR